LTVGAFEVGCLGRLVVVGAGVVGVGVDKERNLQRIQKKPGWSAGR
jgi:hypothetical protein